SSNFTLPDGTQIKCTTSSDKGYSVSTGLDITNGSDHVSVRGLDGKPAVSGVQHDGYEFRAQNDAAGLDNYRMGGRGDDWYLERNGQDLGKVTGSHMDARTGRYEQETDGSRYQVDPNLRPPVGSEAW